MVTQDSVLEALKKIQDPDLHKDIVSLGFIQNLSISPSGAVAFDLVLTTPACPVKDDLKDQAAQAVRAIPGVTSVDVKLSAQVAPRLGGQDRSQLLPGVRNVVAVASGKGGVGKSTVTANIAAALVRQGATVGILDADIYGPSQGMMLGVKDDPEMDEHKRIHPPSSQGIKVISMSMFAGDDAPVVWRGPMVSQMVQNFVGQVEWGELDYLLIDMPPGTGDIQLTLTQQTPITAAVIVTTPQDVALLDAKKGLLMFEKVSVPVLGLVENMSGFVCDGCGKVHDIFRRDGGRRIARTFGLPFLGAVPIEPGVALSGDEGQPIVFRAPESLSAKAFSGLSGRIASELSMLRAEGADVLDSFELQWADVPEETLEVAP
jgi:ATP-binding protein involved in chromosome partitioning